MAITDALSMTHDAAGNLTAYTDPANNTTVYAYDGLNRRKSETNALSKTQSFD